MGGLKDPVVLSRLEMHGRAARGFRDRPDLARAFPADHVRTLIATGRPDQAREAGGRAEPCSNSRLALALAPLDPKTALAKYVGDDQMLRAGLMAARGEEVEAFRLARQSHGPEARLLEAKLQSDRPDAAAEAWRRAFEAESMSPPHPVDPARLLSVTNATAEARRPRPAGELVSVVMPARNASAWVAAAVRSVLAQGWTNLEFLFVDDASTDDTAAAAVAAANGDARFRLISYPHRKGAYGARNTALREARGEWIAFQDADEWAHPDRLALQIEGMRDGGAVASSGRGIRIDARGVIRARNVHPLSRWAPSTLMIRRGPVMARAGVFDEVLSGADNEYWWRLIQIFGQHRVIMLRRPLILGASRDDSLTGAADSGFGSRGYNLDRLHYWEAWSLWHLRNARTPERLRLTGGERPFRVRETLRV